MCGNSHFENFVFVVNQCVFIGVEMDYLCFDFGSI